MRASKEIVSDLKKISKAECSTMLGRFAFRGWDPFRILIGTILSARSTDEVTEAVAEEIFRNYPDAKALSKARLSSIERIIRSIGYFRSKAKYIKKTAEIVAKKKKVPDTLDELCALPGVGRKVANCVLVYAFCREAIPVDVHVHRISNRIGWVNTKTPEETELELMKKVPRKHWNIINEQLVKHGKTVCTSRNPKCGECVLSHTCQKRLGK